MTLKTQINVAALKAANLCASTEQTHYYLNGVFVTAYPRFTTYVATDGHRMLVHRENVDAKSPDNTLLGSWILPSDAIAKLKAKKHSAQAILSEGMSGALLLKCADGSETLVRPVDGSFPDWRRVCPAAIFSTDQVQRPQFNLKLLGTFAKCAEALDINPQQITFHTRGLGEPAALTFGPGQQTFGVIMCLRSAETPGDWHGCPDWASAAPVAQAAE